MYKKGAGNDKQGKDAGNRTLCPYRNFSQAINSCNSCVYICPQSIQEVDTDPIVDIKPGSLLTSYHTAQVQGEQQNL